MDDVKTSSNRNIKATKKIKITENAKSVLERRYLKKDETGKICETPADMFKRVADTIAKMEARFGNKENVEHWSDQFYNTMTSLYFLPNSPTLMNAGRDLGQLSACFVLPVEDKMDGIFDSVKHAALIHKSGGGTGFSFSRLRPEGALVGTTQGVASGPISFMTVFDRATEVTKQGGTRRGANMGILRIDHPDIEKFIKIKEDGKMLQNFNLSVGITEEFMKRVKDEEDYDLIDPKTKQSVKKLNAKEVFDLIVLQAWKSGDPGIVFLDRMNQYNPTPHLGEIESTNPCGEQPLLPYESCNLGSLNLALMVRDGEIDWNLLGNVTKTAVRFLDNVIEANKFPLPQIEKMTKGNRKIGLGVMGWADMLIDLEIPYNSEEAIELARKIMKFVNDKGHEASQELASERGTFPNFSGSIFDKQGIEMRNATITTIAPTGTISMIGDCSSGVEPLFAVVFVKNVMDNTPLLYIHPAFEKIAKREGFASDKIMKEIAEHGTVKGVEGVPQKWQDIFASAHDISPEWHIRMQAAFQEFTDNAVSKTINFGHDAVKEDIAKSYILAYKYGLKGITIFRDGSKDEQVLYAGNSKKDKKDGNAENIIEGSPEVKIVPKERPEIIVGKTLKVKTGCGNIFVTVNFDEDGQPFEVFSAMGKAGGCASSQAEAISRTISLSLRSGVSIDEILKQLKGISCHMPFGFGPQKITSCSDAIARAIVRLTKKEEAKLELNFQGNNETPVSTKTETLVEEFNQERSVRGACPECGGAIEHEGGCSICRDCGHSACA